MKILIINDRYFVSGGPERYLFNLKLLMEKNGHSVIPFSIKYSMNEFSEYEKYFVSPLAALNEVYFREHSWTVRSFFKTVGRLFFSSEVYNKLSQLIIDEKPDFAIVLNFYKKMSPSILIALKHHNIPFAVRLSDFGMICPNGHLIRDDSVCELCIRGSLINSVIHKCVQNSYGASLLSFIAKKYHQYLKTYNGVGCFIVPSEFTKKKMIEAGWEENILEHVPTFVFPEENIANRKKKKQVIYVGRIERIKGVHLLLEANKILSDYFRKEVPIIITGSGREDYFRYLREFTLRNGLSNVEFVGSIEKNELIELLKESAVSVVPSLWYDNMPNSVLESLSCGTCVVASNHGSFVDIVKNGETGLLFKPNDVKDLAEKIKYLLDNFDVCLQMGQNGIKYIKAFHSPDQHYHRLIEISSRLIQRNNMVSQNRYDTQSKI